MQIVTPYSVATCLPMPLGITSVSHRMAIARTAATRIPKTFFAFFIYAPPAVVKDHLQCIECDGRHSNPNTIQDNIVYIKAVAKYRLQQLDPQCSHKSSN